jgi:hypothetical protein
VRDVRLGRLDTDDGTTNHHATNDRTAHHGTAHFGSGDLGATNHDTPDDRTTDDRTTNHDTPDRRADNSPIGWWDQLHRHPIGTQPGLPRHLRSRGRQARVRLRRREMPCSRRGPAPYLVRQVGRARQYLV